MSTIGKRDSIQLARSEAFYKKLQNKSKGSKFTKLLHGLMFEPVNPSNKKKSNKKIEDLLQRDFSDHQGKIIRKIKITTYDPFGYSEKDTTVKPSKRIDNYGNVLHAKTKPFTVRGLILLEKNKPLDSLLVLESERLLRSRKFIRRALIRPEEITKSSDSIDLHIYVLDSWSLGIDGDISTSKGEIRLREYNFFGLGHQYTTAYKQDFDQKENTGFTLGYKAQNLYNTYINAEVFRDVEVDQSYLNTARINRNFYSPYTRWAGEVSLYKRQYYENFYNQVLDTIVRKPIKTEGLDTWGGLAIPLQKRTEKGDLPTNIIIAARYSTQKFLEKPDEKVDSVAFFSNQNIKLGSIGIRQVNYVRDRYIFRNGDIEDIGVGHSYFINSGVQSQNGENNFYLGVDLTLTNYFADFGYLAANLQYGSYFRNGETRQSLFKAQGTYFTPIFHFGNWYMRQFVKTNMTVGINRKDIIKDRLNLGGYYGIDGFNSNEVFGTRKFVFNFQTQSYVPFSWWGFRMSPFIGFDLGFIGEAPQPFFKNDLYTRFGFGFLISNDYFVFESIKLSFSFFPKVPGRGENIMRFDGNFDNLFRLDEYEYREPHILEYR
ncbi:ShlB/FhaC/HecB family hemolysin secretion/activation protein [Mesonia aestuariivivens]|uniref:ShlB/FhaC/HecB family hemolysin secretion/activation protein n=1 Tax=Mesonia aestuariivivens TaxID=2796128 RepID=A0ABS6W4C8_9FLAO|nr:ShlB/FhaC/HecB family hemolysin secretion/activation protein [Mesonia aestuariivivens]MBW2962569.1 ShlB/FhaC/HecB family hemolysin secretion/activation protein [Mesonia aestuariivivens]